jgi:hypothetical protein
MGRLVWRIVMTTAIFGTVGGALGKAHAGNMVGTQVTGYMSLAPGWPTTNLFDPAVGYALPGDLNAAGTTVTISSRAEEFGAADPGGSFRATADFTGTQLTIAYRADVPTPPYGPRSQDGFWMQFSDAALVGKTLTLGADTLPNISGPLDYRLSGGELIVAYAGGPSPPIDGQAVFTIGPFETTGPGVGAAPEPSTLILVGIAALVAAGYRWRCRRWAAA